MSKRNLSEPLLAAIDSIMSQMHVCLPGRVERYQYATQRADVKPMLRRRYTDGEVQGMPVIADVPVVWPRSGGASLTMPIKQGDGVLLVFADRSIDNWLAEGGEVTPDDRRKHALSDCIAVPGLYSFADTSPQDNNDDVLLQYAGSSVRLTGGGDIEAETGGSVHVTASADVTVNCTNAEVTADATTITSTTEHIGDVTITGNLTVSGVTTTGGLVSLGTAGGGGAQITGNVEVDGNVDVTVDVTGGGISLNSHTHPGDSGGTTGAPQ